jgi:hypothetical protein
MFTRTISESCLKKTELECCVQQTCGKNKIKQFIWYVTQSKILLVLFFAGMGIFVFGLFWLIGGSLGSFYGSDVLLNGGAIATISGLF